MKALKLFFLFYLFFAIRVFGQDNHPTIPCASQLDKSYITDEQYHQITIHPTKFSQLHVIFYPQFTYKIIICSKNETVPVEFNLSNESGDIFFNNTTMNYQREWNFKVNSFMKGIINIRLASHEIKDLTIKIMVGYKISEKN
jgi:hypothetical protein